MIPDEVISEIRERVDMVALVSEYVRLKKRGNNHVGLCPFHAEKTPSFNVHAHNRFYYCFGCQASGDPFSFLMQLEGIGFPQAARQLAERTGVEVPDEVGPSDAAEAKARARRERLAAVMDDACAFFERQLVEHPQAAIARDELARRGVSTETAGTFRLGYAPHGWDSLVSHLRDKSTLDEAQELGLIAPRRSGHGHYDRFRGRLMFPIRDLSGTVVAFSGRTLPLPAGTHGGGSSAKGDGSEPKYVNSPEHALYSKGAVLFGLHEARVPIRRDGWALLCEGNFDLLALREAGLPNVVAPLGTAFTAHQAKLLSRFASRVTLLFDGDAAGLKAIHAAYPLLRRQELTARVARLPPNEDPDSFVRGRGADALRALVDASPGIVEFLIDSAAEQAGSGGAPERAAAIERLGPVLAAVDNPVEIQMYIERVAQRFGVTDQTALRAQLRRGVVRQRSGGRARPGHRGEVAPPIGAPPSAAEEKSTLAPGPRRVKLPKLQTEVLGALLDRPALFATPDASRLEGLLSSPELQEVFRAARRSVQQTGDLDVSELFSAPESQRIKDQLARAMYQDRDDAWFREGLRRLEQEKADHEARSLDQAIREARRAGENERAVRLTRQRDALKRSACEQLRRER